MKTFGLVSSIIIVALSTAGLGLSSSSDTPSSSCKTMYILNVLPFPDNSKSAGWDRGFELIPAGQIAIQHINNRTNLLDGYKLKILDIPSEACGRNLISYGLVELYGRILDTDCVVGVTGFFCSAVTASIGPLLSHSNFGYVQLSSATSPLFQNVTDMPYLFRIIASSKVFNSALIAMMDTFNWSRISVIHDTAGFYFRTTARNFESQISLEQDKVLVSSIPIFKDDNIMLKVFDVNINSGSRIGFYSVTELESTRIICEVYKQNLLWPNYVYVFHERTVTEFLSSATVSCSHEEMLQALEGVFVVQYRLTAADDDSLIVSGQTYKFYHDEYLNKLKEFANETNMELEDNEYANTLYDQIWALALALNNSLDRINLRNGSIVEMISGTSSIRELLAEELKEVSFHGASGRVNFGSEQEGQTSVDVFQIQNGQKKLIGIFDSFEKNLSFIANFSFQDIPGDSFRTEYYLSPLWLVILVLILQALLGILITFNVVSLIYWRKKPEMKSTSVPISLIMLTGCYFLCVSPVVVTVLSSLDNSHHTFFNLLCNLKSWVSLCGFNIILVPLLFRLIRIYHIFGSFRTTGKYWSDKYLVLYITLVCSVEVLILVIWTAVDVSSQESQRLYISHANPPYYLIYTRCASNYQSLWVILSYSWLVLILILTVLLAIQTRHIKRKHFKDTKKVNMFVFSLCLFFALFIPLSYLLQAVNIVVGAFVFEWLAYFMVSFSCQLFLFLPKVIPVYLNLINKAKKPPDSYDLRHIRNMMATKTFTVNN